MTPDQVRSLPVVVDVVSAGRVFGLGRDASYDLARKGAFPVPVLRLGRRCVVARAALLTALGLEDAPSKSLADSHNAQFRGIPADSESAGVAGGEPGWGGRFDRP